MPSNTNPNTGPVDNLQPVEQAFVLEPPSPPRPRPQAPADPFDVLTNALTEHERKGADPIVKRLVKDPEDPFASLLRALEPQETEDTIETRRAEEQTTAPDAVVQVLSAIRVRPWYEWTSTEQAYQGLEKLQARVAKSEQHETRAGLKVWKWVQNYAAAPALVSSPRAKETLLNWYRAAEVLADSPATPFDSAIDDDTAAHLTMLEFASNMGLRYGLTPRASKRVLMQLLAERACVVNGREPPPFEGTDEERAVLAAFSQHGRRVVSTPYAPPIVESLVQVPEMMAAYQRKREALRNLARFQAAGLAEHVPITPVLVQKLEKREWDPVELLPSDERIQELARWAGTRTSWDTQAQLNQLPPIERARVMQQLVSQTADLVTTRRADLGEAALEFFGALLTPLSVGLRAVLDPIVPDDARYIGQHLAKGWFRLQGMTAPVEELEALKQLPLDPEDRREIEEATASWKRIAADIDRDVGVRDTLYKHLGPIGTFVGGLIHNGVVAPFVSLLEVDEDAAGVLALCTAPKLARTKPVKAAAAKVATLPPIRDVLAWRMLSPSSAKAADRLFERVQQWEPKTRERVMTNLKNALNRLHEEFTGSELAFDRARASIIERAIGIAEQRAAPERGLARLLYKISPRKFFEELDPFGFVAEQVARETLKPFTTLRRQVVEAAQQRQRAVAKDLIEGWTPPAAELAKITNMVLTHADEAYAWRDTAARVLKDRHTVFSYLLDGVRSQVQAAREQLERMARAEQELLRAHAEIKRLAPVTAVRKLHTRARLIRSSQLYPAAREALNVAREQLSRISEHLKTLRANKKETEAVLNELTGRQSMLEFHLHSTRSASLEKLIRGDKVLREIVEWVTPADMELLIDQLDGAALVADKLRDAKTMTRTLVEMLSIPQAPGAFRNWVFTRFQPTGAARLPASSGMRSKITAIIDQARAIKETLLHSIWSEQGLVEEGRSILSRLTSKELEPLRASVEKIFARPIAEWGTAIKEYLPESAQTQLAVGALTRFQDFVTRLGQELVELGVWDDAQFARHLNEYIPYVYRRVKTPSSAPLRLSETPPSMHAEILSGQRAVIGHTPYPDRPWRLVYSTGGKFTEEWFKTRKEAVKSAVAKFGRDWRSRSTLFAPVTKEEAIALGFDENLFRARLERMSDLVDLVARNRLLLSLKRLTGLVLDPDEFARLAPEARVSGEWIQLSGEGYGRLEGHYVHRRVGRALRTWSDMTGFFRHAIKAMEAEGVEMSFMSMPLLGAVAPVVHALGKVTSALRKTMLTSYIPLNPISYIVNTAFNIVTGGLGLRLSPYRMVRALVRGAKMMRERDPLVARAAEAGLDIGTDPLMLEGSRTRMSLFEEIEKTLDGGRVGFLVRRIETLENLPWSKAVEEELAAAKRELARRTGLLARLEKGRRFAVEKVWELYGSIDYAMRLGAVQELIDDGMDLGHAVEQVRTFMQNYREVPLWVRHLSRTPFGGLVPGFIHEWSRIGLNLMRKRPIETLAFLGVNMANSIFQMAATGQRFDDEPGGIRRLIELASTFRVGPVTIDLANTTGLSTFLVPAGVLRAVALDLRDEGALGELGFILASYAGRYVLNNLETNLVIGLATGRDMFTNRLITDDTERSYDKMLAYGFWALRTLLPPLLPGISKLGGRHRVPSYYMDILETEFVPREGRILPLWERALKVLGGSIYHGPVTTWSNLIGEAGQLVWTLGNEPGAPLAGRATEARRLISDLVVTTDPDKKRRLVEQIKALVNKPIYKRVSGQWVEIERPEEGGIRALKRLAEAGPVAAFARLPLYAQTHVLAEGVRRGLNRRDRATFENMITALLYGEEVVLDPMTKRLREDLGVPPTVPAVRMRVWSEPSVIERALKELTPDLQNAEPALRPVVGLLTYRLLELQQVRPGKIPSRLLNERFAE